MRNLILPPLVWFVFLMVCNGLSYAGGKTINAGTNPYPSSGNRKQSPGGTVYYVDPITGNDSNKGISKSLPWKTFMPVNQLILAPGDRVEVMTPGDLPVSLNVQAEGTEEQPVVIHFAAGQYDFSPEQAVKRRFHISNTNDTPDSLKSVAFCFSDSRFIKVEAHNAIINLRGKVMETCIDHCENVEINGIHFGYRRPTVSEMTITLVKNHYAEAEVHPDSWFAVKDSMLTWIGEGWSYKAQDYWQIYDPETQKVWRNYLPIDQLKFSKIDGHRIGIYFRNNPAFRKGLVFQTRDVRRDYAANFAQRSKNIVWNKVTVSFMHGMGFVSQFCENISFSSLTVAPSPQSGRTCAAWADILHFSGCRGLIEIKNSYLSAANDDAVNVHGTHLRVVQVLSVKQVKVRFMHSQTYGFDAFIPGDSIAFVDEKTLLSYASNKVETIQRISDYEYVLTLSQPVPDEFTESDVIDNTTWAPDVHIRGCTVTAIPTRGFLVSTRGKVVIENNDFIRTQSSAVLVADDAQSWYESGVVRDVTIRNNRFASCGEPVVAIHPENTQHIDGQFIHQNIVVSGNRFSGSEGQALYARSTANLLFKKNRIELIGQKAIEAVTDFDDCRNFQVQNNSIVDKKRRESPINK